MPRFGPITPSRRYNSQITRRTGQLCPSPDTPTFQVSSSYLASDSAFDEEKARNDALKFQPGQFEPPWERWLKLDPLFAGCLPSNLKPVALIGARQMAQKTTPCGRVCPFNETEPSKYDPAVLLALNPIRVYYESIILSGIAGDRILWSLALDCPLCPSLGRLHVERSLGA